MGHRLLELLGEDCPEQISEEARGLARRDTLRFEIQQDDVDRRCRDGKLIDKIPT